MAGTVTHLAIADIIYRTSLARENIINLPLFYCGNLAPDAVHAKPDYQRADKTKTHLREGISSAELHNDEKHDIYKERIDVFLKKHYFINNEYKDLYLGYAVHLRADELFTGHACPAKARVEERMHKDGIVFQNEQEFTRSLVHDMVSTDIIFANKWEWTQNPVQILESVWDYEVKGYVGKTETNNSKCWVIDTFFKTDAPKQPPIYYTYPDACEFVEFAAKDILQWLAVVWDAENVW